MVLRILGLNDDNHSPCFRCEDGTTFSNCQQLVEFLSKPHDVQVEVKMFAIVDEWTAEMEELGEEKIDELFYFVEGYGRQPEDYTLEQAFNLFWNAADRENW